MFGTLKNEKFMNNLKSILSTNISNALGWRTNRKIVVFQSDDWGAIRLPKLSDYDSYKAKFPRYASNPYLRYDSIASKSDLESLFNVLSSFTDINGNNPIFTFNVVTSNPAFKKIKSSGFSKYSSEIFTETLKKFHSVDPFETWLKAISENLLEPQFHGREHVNVKLWLSKLRENDEDFIKLFKLNCWANPITKFNRVNIQAALDDSSEDNLKFKKEFIKNGVENFSQIFGCVPSSFIANNYILGTDLYDDIKSTGIKAIQSMKYQKLPLKQNQSRHKLILRKLGVDNKSGLTFLIRNAYFEPSQTSNDFNDVSNCLKMISNAFFWNKPAIIDTHRLNYVGTYDLNNKVNNICNLESLLKEIIRKWPEVEFLSSNELTNEIKFN